LKNDFDIENVTFVGDKGMLRTEQLNEITNMNWHYITFANKNQMKTLLKRGATQMEIFKDKPMEKSIDGIRFILLRNAVMAKGIQKNRQKKIHDIETKIQQQNIYLYEHPKAKLSTATKNIEKLIERKKLRNCLGINVDEDRRYLELLIDKEALKQEEQLDNCYVIKTDLQATDASKEIVHNRYRNFLLTEIAFRTFNPT
jgi:sulfur transfer complex TusBCD TusB component (DsrH family)